MMTIETWLLIALLLSLFGNCILYWFSREQSSRLTIVSENISDLLEIIEQYRMHLKSVYSLEAYYGDETLQYLMDHTRSLSLLLEEQYADIIMLTDPIEYVETEETESEEEEIKEQDVLYAGTRERNS